MAYTKQSWVNGVSPASANRMNHIEEGIAAALDKEDADATYAPLWQPSTAYTAGTPVLLPDGTTGTRTTTGTSRPTFDATEEAAWTVAAGGLDETAVAASISNPETTVNAAVITVVESVIPSSLISTVVVGNDLSHARPPGGGAVHWVTTEPAPAQPLNIQSGDFISRVTETLVEWTPMMLPNLFAWYDAESISAAADSAVAQWNDLSGNGHHAKQATVANQPLYRAAGFNGHPCLEFDGTNDILLTDPFTPSIGEAWTVYAAVHSTPATTTGSDFFFGAVSNTNVAQRLDGYRTTGGVFTITRGTALAGPALDNTPRRLRAVFNGGGSSLRVGDTITSGTTPLSGVNVAKLALGGRGDAANFLQGFAAGFVHVKGTVSVEDDAHMVAWMQDRYSLA